MTDRLDARPTTKIYELEALVRQAWAGNVRIPHFQRDYRWGSQDVSRLFDSILKGYPIGSLLLWIRPAPAGPVRLGALEIEAPAENRALWVVDGQQRLTSLANTLHPDGGEDPRFRLAYDLRERTLSRQAAPDSPWLVPLSVIFDLQRLLQWFAARPEISHLLNEASEVATLIRQFSIPAYQVEHGEVEALQDIFDRMNNYGKPLRRAEVFSALNAGDETADRRLDIQAISEQIDAELRFGRIDDNTVLQAILARRGVDTQRDIRLEFDDHRRRAEVEFPDEDRDAAYGETRSALARAVSFLQHDAGVPHVGMLPYRYLLVVLSRYFAHHPDPVGRDRVLLRRWYWRAALVGTRAWPGGTAGATRKLNTQIRPGDPSGSIQRLLTVTDPAEIALPDGRSFRTNNAATKIMLCGWWALAPRSWTTGAPYEQTDLAATLDGRTTAGQAIAPLFRRGEIDNAKLSWSANQLLLLDSELIEPESVLGGRHPMQSDQQWAETARSHGITVDAAEAVAGGHHTEFLEIRQRTLDDVVASFLRHQCEHRFEDTPPLAEFDLDDEGDNDDS
ncbi:MULTISPECIES: DUF262 domain-containing protein [Actinoalloteichus]|uniref:GmrSD restriction endonucleases N-terminal domain-containing protein n=1 Tax=Actinoalloteichus fjordicus TaxID=1612552 RepID=A0AAC9PTS8_9PSEU|nr:MULTISPECIES: DUF262 domain-containing protein [Actinoalloteichus]APU16357.1 Protein of unknown function DUF262 [Actinoalloteichus fjordicus]APU22415.1 Protein of unknown function DUF262 [Actinoalloteichus sp. GBA129-24]